MTVLSLQFKCDRGQAHPARRNRKTKFIYSDNSEKIDPELIKGPVGEVREQFDYLFALTESYLRLHSSYNPPSLSVVSPFSLNFKHKTDNIIIIINKI